MKLRPYQHEAVAAVETAWADVDKVLIVMPTGTGKTIIFANLTRNLVAAGKRVLILAHRGELLEQAADKLEAATGLKCAVEKAEKSCLDAPACFFRVVVGSVQSISRDDRLHKFAADYFDMIVIDEAHHALSPTYAKICDHFRRAKYLGVTATPDRGDFQNLSEFFETLAYEYSLVDAIKEGFLKPIKALTVPLSVDLTGCKQQAGDYKSSDIGHALDPYLDEIALAILKHCKDRKTVIFTPLIMTSERLTACLVDLGINAVEINGMSPDRKEILEDFQLGDYDVIVNSMLLNEGWDCPVVDCIVVLRPTRIRSLYCQMIGRGTRLHHESDDLLILDFLWHTERHQLCMPAHLIAKNADVANAMIKKMGNGQAWDLEDAERDAIEEREGTLAAQLEQLKRRKSKMVDPLQFAVSIGAEDLMDYEPNFGWERADPTKKQLEYLDKIGFEIAPIDSRGKACAIINRLHSRREKGLSTPRQIRCLERFGYEHVGQWTFEKATATIGTLAKNNWRKYDSV